MIVKDAELFWTMFGAIGTTSAALATFLAVIVALWQTKYQNRVRLKLSFHSSIALSDSRGADVRYIGVNVKIPGIKN